MRKLLLSATLIASGLSLFAQKLDEVQENISKGKYSEAQEKLDKFLANPKNQDNANAYYYQGVIYNELAKDSTKTDKDYRMEAFNAFRKYQQMDPKNILMTLNQNAGLFQLYEGYYNSAIASYNAQQFDKAYHNFKNALEVERYINSKGFSYSGTTLPALDTSLILNTAAMALKANLEDTAMKYYASLADAKLKGPNFQEIYQMLVEYYGKKNDETNRNKYLALGQELYPENEYWLEANLTPYKDDKAKLFAKYEELMQANPDKYFLAYNYAVELYNYLHANNAKPADAATLEPKLEPAIAKAIAIKSTPEGNFLMVKYYLDNIYNLQDQYRSVTGKTPADTKKRQGITAQINDTYDKIAPYAEAAYAAYDAKGNLTPVEKATFRNITNVLIDYYTYKKQTDKVQSYQNKLKSL